MKKYAVAFIDFFDNENKVFVVYAESCGQVIKKVYVDTNPNVSYILEWCSGMSDDVDEIKSNFIQCDLSVDVVEII